jgi:hypothetical protein
MNVNAPVVIRCGMLLPGQPESLLGAYLTAYDQEADDGLGTSAWGHDKVQALVFPSFIAAHAAWSSASETRPLRDDGKPNRPLTQFSVTFEDAP